MRAVWFLQGRLGGIFLIVHFRVVVSNTMSWVQFAPCLVKSFASNVKCMCDVEVLAYVSPVVSVRMCSAA